MLTLKFNFLQSKRFLSHAGCEFNPMFILHSWWAERYSLKNKQYQLIFSHFFPAMHSNSSSNQESVFVFLRVLFSVKLITPWCQKVQNIEMQRLEFQRITVLRNKLRSTWGWAEVLSMVHIVQILNLSAWPVVFSMSLLCVHMHRGARPKVSLRTGPQVKGTVSWDRF